MRVLLLDGYNLMHRARYGFTSGPYNVVYNFFRGIRPLIEKFSPDKVYVVMEGHPKFRYELFPEYKANRKKGMTPEKQASYEDFKRQREIIYDLLAKFPFDVIHHPDYEGDDLIANLIRWKHSNDECIVISNDTDFIQLYAEDATVSVYSPVKKEFLLPTEYNYVQWKSLVGDTSDNIWGVPRVGNKTALKILNNGLEDWLEKNPDKAKIYWRNHQLISFADMEDDMEYSVWSRTVDFEYIKEKFNEMEFYSMTKEKTWDKFVSTFERLGE